MTTQINRETTIHLNLVPSNIGSSAVSFRNPVSENWLSVQFSSAGSSVIIATRRVKFPDWPIGIG